MRIAKILKVKGRARLECISRHLIPRKVNGKCLLKLTTTAEIVLVEVRFLIQLAMQQQLFIMIRNSSLQTMIYILGN